MNLAHLTPREGQPSRWQRFVCFFFGHPAPRVEWSLGQFDLRKCERCSRLIWTKGDRMIAYHSWFFDEDHIYFERLPR